METSIFKAFPVAILFSLFLPTEAFSQSDTTICQSWENDEWVNQIKTITHYNITSGAIIREELFVWDGSGWNNTFLHVYTFNDNGDAEMNQFFTWDQAAMNWLLDRQHDFMYDGDGNLTDFVLSGMENGGWTNLSRDSLVYNEEGHLLESYRFTFLDNQWVFSTRDIFTYDNDDNQISGLNSNWVDNEWVGQSRFNCSFNNDNQVVEHITEVLEQGVWQFSRRILFSYTEEGWQDSLTILIRQAEAWLPFSQIIREFDDSGNMLLQAFQSWDDENGRWENLSKGAFSFCEGQKQLGQVIFSGSGELWTAERRCFLVVPSSESVITETTCETYVVPSGDEQYVESGTYYDTIPNVACGDSIITILLSVFDLDTTVINNDDTLMAVVDGASYQWLDCDNGMTPIPGATLRSFSPDRSGYYAVRIDINNCIDTSGCHEIRTTGFEHVDGGGRQVGAHPVPTSGPLTIDLGKVYGEVIVSVSDAGGKKHSVFTVANTDRIPVVIRGSAGLYIVTVRTPDNLYRIMITKR